MKEITIYLSYEPLKVFIATKTLSYYDKKTTRFFWTLYNKIFILFFLFRRGQKPCNHDYYKVFIGTFGTVYWDFWYGLLGLLVRWITFYWDLKYGIRTFFLNKVLK